MKKDPGFSAGTYQHSWDVFPKEAVRERAKDETAATLPPNNTPGASFARARAQPTP